MIALAKSLTQQDPIYLTDATLEREKIVKRALDLIYTLGFDYVSDEYDPEIVSCVIKFAKKWEISLITDIIRKDLDRAIKSKIGPNHPFDYFLIALSLADHELAAAYFKLAEKDGWLPKDNVWVGGDISVETGYLSDTPKAALSQKHPLLDIHIDKKFTLGQIPHVDFLSIPPTVVWIILRAQSLEGKTEISSEDVVKQLLDLACTSQSGSHEDSERLISDPPAKTEESSKKRKIQD